MTTRKSKSSPPAAAPAPTPDDGRSPANSTSFSLRTPIRTEGVGGPPLAPADAPTALRVFGKDVELRLARDKAVFVIGSAPKGEIDLSLRVPQIEEPDRISRIHAVITRVDNWLRVTDHNSANGTFYQEMRQPTIHVAAGGRFVVDVVPLLVLNDRLLDARTKLHRFLGFSDIAAVDRASEMVVSPGPLAIAGPTGSEHDRLAEVVHKASSRADRPFVYISLAEEVDEKKAEEVRARGIVYVAGSVDTQKAAVARARRGTVYVDLSTGTLTQPLLDVLLSPDYGVRPIFGVKDAATLTNKLGSQIPTITVPAVSARRHEIPHLFNAFFVSARSTRRLEELRPDRLNAVCAAQWSKNLSEVRDCALPVLAYLEHGTVAAAARALRVTDSAVHQRLRRIGVIEPQNPDADVPQPSRKRIR